MKVSQIVEEYIEHKQATGSCFKSEAVILRSFCRSVGDISITDIPVASVQSYLAGSGPVTLFFHRKHQTLGGFYRFAIARGCVSSSPLPRILPKPSRVFVPYVFSVSELQCLLDSNNAYKNGRGKLDAFTMRALLLLLYGSGLRIGEALSLTLADVDLSESLLRIHDKAC